TELYFSPPPFQQNKETQKIKFVLLLQVVLCAQPQCLPQPNTSALERSEEESGRIQNGHVGLSNGSGIHNGVKHMPADNRKLSSPVSEKMHRKIQSTLSVNSNSNKKSKISSVFSQKQGTSPEGKLIFFLKKPN
uniref:MyoD family inhibitor domain containing n=1 Tax=Ficedula albicollis TaxID=59894 RepID=A0A803WCC7_FICAL